MNKLSGVYEIKNILNGHGYIGSAVNISSRWWRHKNDLQLGDHHSQYLQRAWNKYGEDSFEFNILLICDPKNNILYEQAYMDKMKPEYNISPTAGSPLGVKHTAETRKNMSVAKRNITDETRRKMSIAQIGKTHSKETKRKLSVINSGENNPGFGKHHSEETKRKLSIAVSGKKNHCFGKHHTAETKRKMSLAGVGRPKSEEHKRKISAGLSAYWERVRVQRNGNE